MNFTMLSNAAEKVDGVQVEGSMKGWINKIKSLVQTYLSPTKDKSGKYYIDIPENRAKQFEASVNNATEIAKHVIQLDFGERKKKYASEHKEYMPEYKLPEFNLFNFNTNDYLRYAAEQVVGFANKGKLGDRVREILLKETLSLLVLERDKLERLMDSYRSRLPGNSAFGALSDVIQGGFSLKSVANAVLDQFNTNEMNDPINRPDSNKKTSGWEKKGNNRPDGYIDWTSGNNMKSFKSYIDYTVASDNPDFGENLGMKTTFEDLIGLSNEELLKIESVEDLFDILKSSSSITTANSVTTDSLGNYKVNTLDSNNYWEIILRPYIGELNGNYTFLPPIREAYVNRYILTGKQAESYYKDITAWLPITSFDLQKSKLVNKTLGLSDGEISYPTSIEYTNEFRITMVDDQDKTWRNYFERCMQSMVYSCNPKIVKEKTVKSTETKKEYIYGRNGEVVNIIDTGIFEDKTVSYVSYLPEGAVYTEIDKNYQLIAPYKNVTFICEIYVMNPQKATVNKYSLLLTLKDFSEERTGEIDGSGTDLSLSFSIVGENPPQEAVAKRTGVLSVLNSRTKKRLEKENAATEAEKKRKSSNLVAGVGGTLTSLI